MESQAWKNHWSLIWDENNIIVGDVIGDRLSDILAAKENGLSSIGVNFDFAQPEELKHADKVINHLNELLWNIKKESFLHCAKRILFLMP